MASRPRVKATKEEQSERKCVLFAAAGVCDQPACTWPEQCAGADVFRLIDAYMPTGMGACRWSERKW